ncbi:Subtilase family protein [Burkholderia sp. GAS332]|nr:Subtilase family protein [Burkholderia sp. GAS332]
MEPGLEELLRAGNPDDEVAVLLRLTEGGAVPSGTRIVAGFPPIYTARVRRGSIPAVRAAEGVLSMKAARRYVPDWLDLPVAESDDIAPRSSDERRPEDLAQTGRGVVLGLVDWGLDIAHPDLRNADGTTRVLALWDQRERPGTPPNTLYGYGRVHDRQAIDTALRETNPYAALSYYPNDAGQRPCHGTHTAAIAAGSGLSGGPTGMAPDTELVFVHLGAATGERGDHLGDSVALVEAIHFIATLAEPRPWVVNLSMGLIAGPHDGSTLTEQAIDAALAHPGRAVVHSTGNYHNRPIHTQGLLRPGEIREIGFQTGEQDGFAHEIDIWYSGRDRITIEAIGPSGKVLARAVAGSSAELSVAGKRVGRLYNRRRDPNNRDNEAHLYLDVTAPRGAWQLRLRAVDVVDGRFHCWIERDPGCSLCQPAFDDADIVERSTTNNICNGLLSIAVGAYDAHAMARPLASFSSWGPTRDGRLKPDLVAPGVDVLSARSAAWPPGADAPLLTRMSGTSMAAPYVAGLVALMFEAAGRPLPVRRTRELLLKVAEPLAEETPQEGWGSGYAAVADAVAAAEEDATVRARRADTTNASGLTRASADAEPGVAQQPGQTTNRNGGMSVDGDAPRANPIPESPTSPLRAEAASAALGCDSAQADEGVIWPESRCNGVDTEMDGWPPETDVECRS